MEAINLSSTTLLFHFQKEADVKQQLLKLEETFREHNLLYLKEMGVQKELLTRIWLLTQRYIFLIGPGPCCKHPTVYSASTEEVLLHEYNEKLQQLHTSNANLLKSLDKLRLGHIVFEELCSKLDMKAETPLILGDTFHKPIAYFIELLSDLFKYFHASVLKFKYHAELLDPANLSMLEEYKLLVEPSEDFEEYLQLGLVYCKCLRPQPLCKSGPLNSAVLKF